MAYLQSNIPHFKAWVRKEYTHNHEKYHGEFVHAMVIAVTTMPTRCLSFQVIFTGAETYDDDNEQNVLGGAMWARMPITALVGDTPFDEPALGLFEPQSRGICFGPRYAVPLAGED